MTDPLTPEERRALGEHERTIRDALSTWFRMAIALAAILNDRLYRDRYATFDDYAQDRWGIKRRYAHYLVASSRTASALGAAGLPVPVAEKHARPLNGLSSEDAVAVWRAVLKAARGPAAVTSELVERAAREYGEGREAEERESSGRLVLSDEGRAEVEAARATLAGGKPVAVPPLVAVPPTAYGDASGTGPVLVPTSYIDRPLDGRAIDDLRRSFEEYYAAAGKKGPTLNLTNEHVGWALWTLNPLTGCTWTCPFCYAREIAALRYPQGFVPTVHPERFLAPANTQIPKRYEGKPEARRVFLMSQADWMDPSFPDPVVQAVLDMCAANPEWEFMTLTKQPARLPDFEYPDNVWVGVTILRQGQVAPAEAALAEVDAAVRWVSFEPLHGQVVLNRPDLVDLYVIGAERKTAQREAVKPTEAAWVDALRLQARSVGAAIWEKANLNTHLREMPTPRRRE